MWWDTVHSALLDELEKIGEVSISGLTPETVLAQQQPQPMETVGYQKAKDILDRAEAIKTAAALQSPTQPGTGRLFAKNTDDPTAVQQAKGLGAYTLGGAGAGRLIGEHVVGRAKPLGAAAEQLAHSKKWWGTTAGAGIGAVEFARRRALRKRSEKTAAAFFSPKMALKSAQQTGTVGHATRATASIAEHVRGSQIH